MVCARVLLSCATTPTTLPPLPHHHHATTRRLGGAGAGVEVLSSRDARSLPLTRITAPLRIPFEMRVIVYGTRDIQPYDDDESTKVKFNN